MKFITKIGTAVATAVIYTVTAYTVRKWLRRKEEEEWIKQNFPAEERHAFTNLKEELPSKHGICLAVKNETRLVLKNLQLHDFSKKITVVQPRPVEQQKYDFMAVTDTKSYFHTKGITGVFTYDIGDTRLFIYYSTSHFRYNTFTFHWDDHSRPAKEDLLQQMSHKKDIRSSKETVTWHSKENQSFEANGYITQGDPVKLYIVVRDTSLHKSCDREESRIKSGDGV